MQLPLTRAKNLCDCAGQPLNGVESLCGCAGLSFKKNPQALNGGDLEEGRVLQGPRTVTGGPASLSSSLPFTPINLIFKASTLFSC